MSALIMVQGTASSVGKSLVVTALCRLYRRRGLRVAPFKAQNMALNSAVTWEGHEIGRAQAAQAEASGLKPSSLMNPVLLKPEGEKRSQVIVRGKSWGSMQAVQYHQIKPTLRTTILECLEELRSQNDLVVIEGAGSPAEINLKDHDIVNMFVARSTQSPVILVGDIDRGGVFAAFVGTMALLEEDERKLVKGFLINKFRGDKALLTSGLDFLLEKTGVPVIGVLPFLRDHRLAEEDSLSLADLPRRWDRNKICPRVAIVKLPRISNFDEFGPLVSADALDVIFTDEPQCLLEADLVILPGSKNTLEDLDWLRQSGCAEALALRVAEGRKTHSKRYILSICGGTQMLGNAIDDTQGVETEGRLGHGLGFLPLQTRFTPQKRTVQCSILPAHDSSSWLTEVLWGEEGLAGLKPGEGIYSEAPLKGYEIHAGQTFYEHAQPRSRGAFLFELTTVSPAPGFSRIEDGVTSDCGQVVGTMVHGLFENPSVTKSLAHWLRSRGHQCRDWNFPSVPNLDENQKQNIDIYDGLADHLANHLDLAELDRLIFGHTLNLG